MDPKIVGLIIRTTKKGPLIFGNPQMNFKTVAHNHAFANTSTNGEDDYGLPLGPGPSNSLSIRDVEPE